MEQCRLMEERAALFAQNFAAMNVAPANETNLQLKSSKGVRDDLMACFKNVAGFLESKKILINFTKYRYLIKLR